MVPLDVTIWNRKPLPLPWVAVDDLVTDGITIREQPNLDRDSERHGRRILFNAWSLTWYERVVRHFHVDAERRGSYELGPFRLRIRDILGRDAAETEVDAVASLVISPRTTPVRSTGHDLAPIGDRRARQGLIHDPALFGGVRPFEPGDSLRRIHWRATARLGEPVSRRFEPARGREVLIALDVQTIDGPALADDLRRRCVRVAVRGGRIAGSPPPRRRRRLRPRGRLVHRDRRSRPRTSLPAHRPARPSGWAPSWPASARSAPARTSAC